MTLAASDAVNASALVVNVVVVGAGGGVEVLGGVVLVGGVVVTGGVVTGGVVPGVATVVTTNCAGWLLVFSFDAHDHCVDDVVRATSVYVPLVVTAEVTFALAYVPEVTGPVDPAGGTVKFGTGAFAHVSAVSDQLDDVVHSDAPALLELPA